MNFDYAVDPAADSDRRYKLDRDYVTVIPLVGAPFESEYLKLERLSQTTSRLTIRAGYCFGPSVPILRNFGWWHRLSGSFVRPSAIHDSIYQLIRLGVIDRSKRADADRILREESAADGMRFWRRWIDWCGVRVGGWLAVRPEHQG